MVQIKRALVSVSDKSGVSEFVRRLCGYGIEIISTGGTAKLLQDNSIPVKEVSGYTGFPEMLDGRVKTLHPAIHAGLLALRDNPQHIKTLQEHGIGLIDMVVVNLYPFEKTTQKPGVGIEDVIENIDIGGPSMLRSAAKNHKDVAVVCDPADYCRVLDELEKSGGALSRSFMRSLAVKAFAHTASYDAAINEYLARCFHGQKGSMLPQRLSLAFEKLQELRYGENPHQKAAFYRQTGAAGGIINLKQLQGKELSFNNILDLNSAMELVKEFELPAAVVVKHNNPCGAAEGKSLAKAYVKAWECDKLSAFGGIVALNRKMDLDTARAVFKSGFLECVIAPAFEKEALSLFKEKKNLRLLECPDFSAADEMDLKRVSAGLLVQDKDLALLDKEKLKVVTKKRPTKKEMASLIFAWKIAKHVKSNAIVLARGTRTVGIGAGQMSRVDSVYISTKKSAGLAKGAVLASDAFFPKEDAIKLAAKNGIKAIIQPGGSIADEAIIKAADKHKISMVFTGMRHFRH